MSDAKLRELERKWKESGSVEDEAAYLRERVRAGDLTQERLELAAYFGHAAAGRALPMSLIQAAAPADLGWERLEADGPEAVVRGLLAVSRAALNEWERPGRASSRPRASIAAVEAWLACKGPEQLDRVRKCCLQWEKEVLSDVNLRAGGGGASPRIPPADPRLASAGYLAFSAARGVIGGLEYAREMIDECVDPQNESYLAPCISRTTVLAALASEVVTWALGYRPLHGPPSN